MGVNNIRFGSDTDVVQLSKHQPIEKVFTTRMHFFGKLHLCRYSKRLPWKTLPKFMEYTLILMISLLKWMDAFVLLRAIYSAVFDLITAHNPIRTVK